MRMMPPTSEIVGRTGPRKRPMKMKPYLRKKTFALATAAFSRLQRPTVHDAGADPAADPIGYGIANHGARDGPGDDRAAIELALLDSSRQANTIKVAGKNRPTRTSNSPKAMMPSMGPANSLWCNT